MGREGFDPKFKQGDIVRCIDPAFGLKPDTPYTIDALWGSVGKANLYYIEGNTNVIPMQERT